MGSLNKYQIVYQGLSEGLHEFNFDINDSFFENREYSEIEKGELTAEVSLNRKPQFLELDFIIEGFIVLTCDRCLGLYNQSINFQGKLFVKFSESESELAEDVICLSSVDYELDVSHYIYESIRLSIPLKRVHPDNKNGETTCDPDMIKKIHNLNTERPAGDNTDPRWDDLKNLMANNNK
ncbi:MAG: DUF177 domain-containing protein [Bacteroidales bacterium]|nr:DUF177 domain-containing protein [Bacteroidales bacterium]